MTPEELNELAALKAALKHHIEESEKANARTMSPLVCKIALAGIEALEDDYNSQEYGRDKIGEQRLLSILTIWKGGEA